MLAIPVKNTVQFFESDKWTRKKTYGNDSIEDIVNLIRYSPCETLSIVVYVNGRLLVVNREYVSERALIPSDKNAYEVEEPPKKKTTCAMQKHAYITSCYNITIKFNSNYLLGLSFLQGRHFVEENRDDHTQFGIIGVLLEMIPFLKVVTPVTNVIGSALWACDIERYKEPTQHPRSSLLAPTPEIVEQGQATDYGSIKNEKEPYPMGTASALPPAYQDVMDSNNLYPSAPPLEKQ
ncbi:hypothetical protein I4U23_012994 [Adineta vaga]|nr:hypothetical protein I4U23_012994 [Adineta vaga]